MAEKIILDAIRDLILSDSEEEIKKVIADNPILLTPEAMKVIRNIIAGFKNNVSIVDDIPQRWIDRAKALENYKPYPPKKFHDTDCGAN